MNPSLPIKLRYLGGSNFLAKQVVCQKFVERHRNDRDKWIELSEWIAYDHGVEIDAGDLPSSLQDLLTSSPIQTRGDYATCLTD